MNDVLIAKNNIFLKQLPKKISIEKLGFMFDLLNKEEKEEYAEFFVLLDIAKQTILKGAKVTKDSLKDIIDKKYNAKSITSKHGSQENKHFLSLERDYCKYLLDNAYIEDILKGMKNGKIFGFFEEQLKKCLCKLYKNIDIDLQKCYKEKTRIINEYKKKRKNMKKIQ